MNLRFGLALKIMLAVLYATSIVCLLLGILMDSNLMLVIGYIALMIASIASLVIWIKSIISKRVFYRQKKYVITIRTLNIYAKNNVKQRLCEYLMRFWLYRSNKLISWMDCSFTLDKCIYICYYEFAAIAKKCCIGEQIVDYFYR